MNKITLSLLLLLTSCAYHRPNTSLQEALKDEQLCEYEALRAVGTASSERVWDRASLREECMYLKGYSWP